jgi:hypothetical protein
MEERRNQQAPIEFEFSAAYLLTKLSLTPMFSLIIESGMIILNRMEK